MDARPSGIYFPFLRDGEKISGSGLAGLGGDVGCGGRMKCGRCGVGVAPGMGVVLDDRVVAMLAKGAGVRGGGALKRCVEEF